MLACPVCRKPTDSLKQMRVLATILVLSPHLHFSHSEVYRSCPPCMRRYIWSRCLINGLLTLIAGFLVLVPYSLALTFATLRKGHSPTVLLGITPEMEANAEGIYAPTKRQKILAMVALA